MSEIVFPLSAGAWAHRLAVFVTSLVLLAVATPGQAQVRWLMATEYAQSNISGLALVTFGKHVAAHTGGYVTTENAFDNTLKIASGDLAEAARSGRVAGGDAFAGPVEAVDPVFGLASLPFLAQSIEEARAINARARPLYEKALRAKELKLLFMTVWPATGLWSVRPLESGDDLKQIAARAYDYNSAAVLQRAGAKAEYLPFNEAIQKVRNGSLNAIVTSGDGGAGRKLWDDLKAFTAINYAIPISLTFVRQADFNALPEAVRAQVESAAAETEASQLEVLKTRTAENYARMRENGVAIADPAPAGVVAPLRSAAGDVIEIWKGKVSPEAAAIVSEAASR